MNKIFNFATHNFILMAEISFLYKAEVDAEHGVPSIDKLIGCAELHRSVLEKVKEFLPQTKSFIWFNDESIKIVLERDEGLEQAFSDYTSLAGPPGFIFAGSDYETANKVLKNHGKRLARIWEHTGSLIGKNLIGRKVVGL